MAFNYKKVGHAAQAVDASVFVASGRADDKSNGRGQGKGKDKTDTKSKKETKDSGRKHEERKPMSRGSGRVYPCNLCKQEGHKPYECPWLEDVSEYVKSRRAAGVEPGTGVNVHIGEAKPRVRYDDDSRFKDTDFVVLTSVATLAGGNSGGPPGCSTTTGTLPQTSSPAGDQSVGDLPSQHVALPTIPDVHIDAWTLLLDTAASVPVVKNADLLVNIRPGDDPIRVDGIGGHLVIDEVGDLLDIGTVY